MQRCTSAVQLAIRTEATAALLVHIQGITEDKIKLRNSVQATIRFYNKELKPTLPHGNQSKDIKSTLQEQLAVKTAAVLKLK